MSCHSLTCVSRQNISSCRSFCSDGGQTYNDKINLSNSSNADSTDAAISAEGGSITVTWWETNETSEEPLVRTSMDFGESFGHIMNLATNETIGEASFNLCALTLYHLFFQGVIDAWSIRAFYIEEYLTYFR